MLEVGTRAPAFTLPDKNGAPVSLSDFQGRKVVLYFYPRDNTPGCTRQACAFARRCGELERHNAVVIGISKDSPASHLKFAEKYQLPFVLLSDPEHTVIEAPGRRRSSTARSAWARCAAPTCWMRRASSSE